MNNYNTDRNVYIPENFNPNWSDIEELVKKNNEAISKYVQKALKYYTQKTKFKENYAEIMSGITFALVVLIFVKVLTL